MGKLLNGNNSAVNRGYSTKKVNNVPMYINWERFRSLWLNFDFKYPKGKYDKDVLIFEFLMIFFGLKTLSGRRSPRGLLVSNKEKL